MKTIPLTHGLFATVNDEDYDFLSQWKWYARKSSSGKTFYARRTDNKLRKTIHMSHVVLGETGQVDHRDGNGLNNTRNNLRPCTHSQNSANRNFGDSKGVRQVGNKYQAYIQPGSSFISSIHDTKEEAMIAYNQMAVSVYGEFARLHQLEEK